ncbi:unnamed protein product [Rotaria socialis]|uniref:cGMP-dependent protein kinase n=4 Tax=Rotaria socialis TaxID=392032 RepID=A0A818MKX5_9BILA|nr:unnamed protein product [Rotaria socialis]CAF3321203.1 unnamed protein product [Rotaria socialis]CAF3591018.1 unnamed protein product [Rotaria socialis]CAF3759809.1 unnamed protein product [Rotaria socialis]CAF4264140.1 unnamed protein product [Rotaria socialis]
MTQSMHDLRLALRDSVKKLDDTENTMNKLRTDYDNQIQKKDEIISMKESIIKEKDAYILKLEQEISKHDSTFISSTDFNDGIDISTSKRTSLLEVSSTTKHQRTKRTAISAEPAQHKKSKDLRIVLEPYAKSDRTKEFLRIAILNNDFMKNLEMDQIMSIVDCMYPLDHPDGDLIIKEGDVGNRVYIMEEGLVEVSKHSKTLTTIGPGRVFGELAILYNCTRTASIKALSDCKLWAVDRQTFQAIMMRAGMQKQSDHLELIRNVKTFASLREDILSKIIDSLDEVSYADGEHIVRQGATGDTFYVVAKGRAQITQAKSKWDTPIYDRHIERGDSFGEKALQAEETRPFNVIADDPNGVTCLVLDRQSYREMIADELFRLKREESFKITRKLTTSTSGEDERDLKNLRLSDIEIVCTLGLGGFGRVELVQDTRTSYKYALKQMKKQHIVAMKQQEHVMNERNIMMGTRSDFIVRLYKTFKDRKYLYMLLESCLGGELWTLLRNRGTFEEFEVRFYSACVIEAFAYLHSKGIVYRDLKPENLLLDNKGYCKLVDFGFSKKVGLGKKTWTFCGTPEYVAPEIILNKGHDMGADCWALGILIFELISGNPPFSGPDPMKTYNIILKGIDAVEFPRKVSKMAALLIKRLCRENPIERIGYQKDGIKDIQKHQWFEGFSWECLKKGTLAAPYTPKVEHEVDTSNFDYFPEDESTEPEDDLTGWDKEF